MGLGQGLGPIPAGGGGSGAVAVPRVAGMYWRPPVLDTQSLTLAMTAGIEYACQFDSVGGPIDRIGVNVTVAAAGSSIRLGVRQYSNGMPGALLFDFGTVSGEAVAPVELAVDASLPAGRVFLTATAQGGAPTITACATGLPVLANTIGNAVILRRAYGQTGVTGPLPQAWGSTSFVNDQPFIFGRWA